MASTNYFRPAYVVPTAILAFVALLASGQAARPRYQVVHDWPVLADGTLLDEVSAVAVDSHDHVFVLTRAGRKWPDSDVLDTSPITAPTVFVYAGRSGRLVTSWGAGIFAMPHSLTIDREDNVWVADVALHQVFKLSHEGKVLLRLGERAVARSDDAHFNRPSDVAIGRDGAIFVSDGYGNSRVMKFARDGKFLLQWGKKGQAAGEFDLPHSIAADGKGHIYIADRQNHRIQVFDEAGSFLAQWLGPPFISPQCIRIAADGSAFVAESGSDKPPDITGVWRLSSSGKPIERIGRYGNYDGQFLDPHWVALSKSAFYVADFTGRRVQKFVPQTTR